MGNPKSNEKKNFDGVRSAAELLNLLPQPDRNRILRQLELRDPGITNQIRDKMFTFEDLTRLTDLGIQLLLKQVPQEKWLLAIRNASDDLKKALYRNMSARTLQSFQEEFASSGPRKLSEVTAVQQWIVEKAKQLLEQGKISLQSNSSKP